MISGDERAASAAGDADMAVEGPEGLDGSERVVSIVIGCDTDPDREAFVGAIPRNTLQWRGMLEGIPALKESVRALRDDAGRAPAFTWLVRADEQVRAMQGSYAWVVEQHRAWLDELRASGDEIGWHPHFWRLASVADAGGQGQGSWYQEIEDVAWQLEMLEATHATLGRAGFAPRSVRMGWDYHNNETLSALARLGVRIDFSALPGMRTIHGVPPRRSENLYDWHRTPDHAYHPSPVDYQRAREGREEALDLIELPIAVARSRTWGLVAGAQLARKTRRLGPLLDALRRPSYCISLTARPALFMPLVDALRDTLRSRRRIAPTFATYFHPDELLPNRTIYALEHVRDNLRSLLTVIHGEGARAGFTTASEFAARSTVVRLTES